MNSVTFLDNKSAKIIGVHRYIFIENRQNREALTKSLTLMTVVKKNHLSHLIICKKEQGSQFLIQISGNVANYTFFR